MIRPSIYDSVPLKLGASSNIRLLELLPHCTSGPLSCILRVAQLSDSPTYTAVSYVWGDAGVTDTILVDGSTFNVRRNLWNLLDQLRHDQHPGGLWIDAICIDQSSLDERSHQVAMMGAIYSKAVDVLSWIGLADEVTTYAMKRLTEMCKKDQLAPDHWDTEFMKGLEEILWNDYWTRVWILQEFLLANSITLHCGQHQISSYALSWVNDSVVHARIDRGTSERYWASPASKIIQARREYQRSSQGFELDRLMVWSPNLNCADVRDRVYAMLALISADESARLAIRPDYSKSVADLFTELYDKQSGTDILGKSVYLPQNLRMMLHLANDDPAVVRVKEQFGDEWDDDWRIYTS